jgi:hydroxymethylpyrimidine/phosphomethylpyrimidine kinase
VRITDDAAQAASAAERQAMRLAFRQSCRYEVDFFDAPRVHAAPQSVPEPVR